MTNDLYDQFLQHIKTNDYFPKKILKKNQSNAITEEISHQENVQDNIYKENLHIDIRGLEQGLNRLYSGAENQIHSFVDYALNGIQIERQGVIRRVATAVTASQFVIDRCRKQNMDSLIVHHGIFWGQAAPLTGHLFRRVSMLIQANIGLLAYHLPMDAHPVLGNSAQFAFALDMVNLEPFAMHNNFPLGVSGKLKEKQNIPQIMQKIEEITQRKPLLLGNHSQSLNPITRVAIVSGGGQNQFIDAVKERVDLFISGEVSEQHYHLAQEEGIFFIAVGHHASERFGPMALARFLEQTELFDQVIFIDEKNPV